MRGVVEAGRCCCCSIRPKAATDTLDNGHRQWAESTDGAVVMVVARYLGKGLWCFRFAGLEPLRDLQDAQDWSARSTCEVSTIKRKSSNTSCSSSQDELARNVCYGKIYKPGATVDHRGGLARVKLDGRTGLQLVSNAKKRRKKTEKRASERLGETSVKDG